MPWNPRNLNDMAGELGRVGGWAPGNYAGKCNTCDLGFMGDKRAHECLPCAAKRLHEYVPQLVQALRKINQLNDHPGYYNSAIQEVLNSVIDTRDVVFPVAVQSS